MEYKNGFNGKVALCKGKTEGLMTAKASHSAQSTMMPPATSGRQVDSVVVGLPVVSKSAEAWSVVVRSRNNEVLPVEVVQIVMREVSLAILVSAHTINSLKSREWR